MSVTIRDAEPGRDDVTAAQGLYRSRGFSDRPPYEGTEIPERLQQHWIFFERQM